MTVRPQLSGQQSGVYVVLLGYIMSCHGFAVLTIAAVLDFVLTGVGVTVDGLVWHRHGLVPTAPLR